MCLGIIRIYANGLAKIFLGFLIATQLAKSCSKIVERIGSMRIELDQYPIKRERLGISSLIEACIALGKEKLSLARVRFVHRRHGQIVARPQAALVQREMQHQCLGYLIGYLAFDAVFEQSPFEGMRKFCSLVDVQSQSTNFVAGLVEDLLKCPSSLRG